ncbi:MAG TPA: IS630 family transposase, partial [Candidatus Obscuribacterales bacterium]
MEGRTVRIAQSIGLADDEHKQLLVWTRGRTTPARLVTRSNIVLLAAQGFQNQEIAESLGVSVVTVRLWRGRFAAYGLDGIESDAPRPGRPRVIGDSKVSKIVEKTMKSRPKNATHWSTREMARAQGVSQSTIVRIWHAHELKPHLVENFKFSNDPQFAEKLRDVVGLYMDPPEKAIVLSVDEKSQIQALDRTQLQLPLRPGIPARQTHDYKRHGTTTLFAALSLLDGTVIGQCLPRHRHDEFLKFLKLIDKETPKDLDLHVIVDNYATHKHENVNRWLSRHKRFHLHFVPTSSSWLNLVERWFGEITAKTIRRGTFKSVPALVQSINEYVDNYNRNPHQFTWTASADKILDKIATLKAIYGSGH